MTAHIPENSVEAQEVVRVPDGTGLSSLRDEAADASSPKASIPSREELIANLEYATKLLGAFPILNATAQVQHLRGVVECARLSA